MAREFSALTPRQLRDRKECGLHEAKKIVETSRLLDAVEAANTIDDLRALVARFITMETGVA